MHRSRRSWGVLSSCHPRRLGDSLRYPIKEPRMFRSLPLLFAFSLILCGCSYQYDITIVGLLLDAETKSPRVGTTVELIRHKTTEVTTTSDLSGRWTIKFSVGDFMFSPDDDGQYWMDDSPSYSQMPDAKFPFRIRVTSDSNSHVFPLPPIPAPEGSNSVTASMGLAIPLHSKTDG